MKVLLELCADRREQARRAMADVEATDAAGEIEIAVAVNVLDGGALGARGENGRGIRRAAWNSSFAARHQSAGLGSGDFGAKLDCFHQRFSVSAQRSAR